MQIPMEEERSAHNTEFDGLKLSDPIFRNEDLTGIKKENFHGHVSVPSEMLFFLQLLLSVHIGHADHTFPQ